MQQRSVQVPGDTPPNYLRFGHCVENESGCPGYSFNLDGRSIVYGLTKLIAHVAKAKGLYEPSPPCHKWQGNTKEQSNTKGHGHTIYLII